MTNWLVRLFIRNADETQNPRVHLAYGRLAGIVGVVCNILLAAGKLAVGLVSGSIAVAGDAVNNLSDAAASVVTLVGFGLAAKPADEEHPFGHARFEYIAGLVVSVLVLVMGLEIGRSSIDKIVNPSPVNFSIISLVVLGASILLKIWMAVFNRSIGRRIGSTALQATYADSRNDVIATGAVLAAALLAKATGWQLDGWMGLGVAVFIIASGIGLVKDMLNPLLGQAPSAQLVEQTEKHIRSYPGVVGTHDLMVHDYGPGQRFASVHVEMPREMDVMEAHNIIDNIERDFLAQKGIHLVIHYDPVVTGDAALNDVRGWLATRVQQIDPRLSIHDLRIVDGPAHINYVFDVVMPPEIEMCEAELRQRLNEAVQRGDKPAHAVVRIDRSYAPIATSEAK